MKKRIISAIIMFIIVIPLVIIGGIPYSLGVGILAVLLLPLSWWLFIFGIGIIVCGFVCISC